MDRLVGEKGKGIVLAGALLFAAACASRPGAPPSAGADALGWTIGHWEGTRTELSTGSRDPVSSDVRSVLGGVGEEEELVVGAGPKPYRGVYLQVFDPKLQKSVLMYVNNTRREFARLEGTASSDRGEWDSTTSRPPRRSRLVYERTGENTWRRTQKISEDDGATWKTLFVDELRRTGR